MKLLEIHKKSLIKWTLEGIRETLKEYLMTGPPVTEVECICIQRVGVKPIKVVPQI